MVLQMILSRVTEIWQSLHSGPFTRRAIVAFLILLFAFIFLILGYVQVLNRGSQEGTVTFLLISPIILVAYCSFSFQIIHSNSRDNLNEIIEDEAEQTPSELEAYPENGIKYLSDPLFQLLVSWAFLMCISAIFAYKYWNTIKDTEYIYKFNTMNRERLPGILLMTTADDGYQVDLGNSTQWPKCGFQNYFGENWATCTDDNLANAQRSGSFFCNCTDRISADNYYSQIYWNEDRYTAFDLSVPFRVNETQTLAQYWIWPGLSQTQVNNDNVTLGNCTRSYMKLALYDADDKIASNLSWEAILSRENMMVYTIPPGNVYDLAVIKESKQDLGKPAIPFYTPLWTPGINTGDCSLAISIYFSSMQQKIATEGYDMSASDYAGQLGGILTIIQGAVIVLIWVYLLYHDSTRRDNWTWRTVIRFLRNRIENLRITLTDRTPAPRYQQALNNVT